MKCPHCGVHFDDADRICPLCGCRVSGRSKKECQINTDDGFFKEKKHTKKTFTHDQTFTKKFTTNPQKPSFTPKQRTSSPTGRKIRKKWIVLLLVIFVVIPFVSILGTMVSNIQSSFGDWTDSNTADANVRQEDFSEAFLGNYTDAAGRQLALTEDNNLQLTENGTTYTGYYDVSNWDMGNHPAYPADTYTGYELYLSFDSGSTPMPGGEDYVFYELYVPQGNSSASIVVDQMILVNYEDSSADVTFQKS